MVFKKIIFKNRYVALETPSRPPPFMANAILNFHFDYLTPSLSWSGSGGRCSWNWYCYNSGPDDHGQDDGLDLAGRTTCRTRFSLNEWFKSNIDISLTSLRSLTLTPLSSYLHFEFLLFKCTKSWRTPLNAFHSMRRFKFAWISLTSCLPDNSSTFLQTLTKRHS